MLGGEELEPAVLGVVGVLVLVDEDPAEAGGVAVADLLEELEQVDRAEQEVVEVHRVHAVDLALVVLVDVGDRLLEERADELAVVLGRAELVLGVGDLRLHRARREALDVDVEVVEALLDQPARVGRVVDRELARVAEAVGVGAQHPRAGRVERHHPHRAGRAADQQLDPLAHLLGGLVGEGDREDLVGPRLAGPQQVGDPVREHAGLARAGAREDQQRPLAVRHRVALGLVQALEESVDPGGVRHASVDGSGRSGSTLPPTCPSPSSPATPTVRSPSRCCARRSCPAPAARSARSRSAAAAGSSTASDAHRRRPRRLRARGGPRPAGADRRRRDRAVRRDARGRVAAGARPRRRDARAARRATASR